MYNKKSIVNMIWYTWKLREKVDPKSSHPREKYTFVCYYLYDIWDGASQVVPVIKNPPANAGDVG